MENSTLHRLISAQGRAASATLKGLEQISPFASNWLGLTLKQIDARYHRVNGERLIRRIVANGTGHPLAAFFAEFERCSDTVYVLGSGASIGAIPESGWQEIQRADSIGFNFWLIHPFVPSLYFLEGFRRKESYQTFLQLIRKRAGQLRGIPFVVDISYWAWCGNELADLPPEIQDSVYLHAPLRMHSKNDRMLRRQLRRWLSHRPRNLNRISALIHHGASLSAITLMAALLGYRRIVLLGVDLYDTKYFWETEGRFFGPFPDNQQTGPVHKTVNPDIRDNGYFLPIDECLICLRDEIFEPMGVSILVGNPRSHLARTFDVVPGFFGENR